ncbi:MAG: type VI secretion system protein TssA [Panacagrimonas sp.]
MLDLEALLAPIDPAQPAGPDLEYDPDWQELERLSQGKPEQQFGNTIIPAEEPDWRDVAQRAETLLGRSKDARAACLLARSQIHLHDFAGLASGLQLIHQLMDRYWDSVHPQLDASDGDDPTMRLNALAALADPQGLLRDARKARLFVSRKHGDLNVRQIEVAAGKLPAREGETALTPQQVEQQIAAVAAEDAALASTVSNSLKAARDLARLLDDKVGSDRSPDLKPLIATLFTVDQIAARAVATLGSGVDESGGEASGESASDAAGVGGSTAVAASGAIRSRADVVVLLDKICEFLERTEPTNPAPLLLQRAKRLMEMNFMQLMNELAPDGLSQVRTITGVQEE